jgi:hypothetical protein
MKWTVVWDPAAQDVLAELWNQGPDRAAISEASDRIDWRLQRDPQSCGEARDDDLRILIELPLAVYFKVAALDRLVSVIDVWRWGSKP